MNMNTLATPPVKKTEFLYLGRCRAKGCKTTVRVSIPAITKTSKVNVNYVPGGNLPPIYEDRSKTVPSAEPWTWISNLGLHCAQHRRQISFDVIKGTFNPDHVCDSRCTGARGPSCDCSCGGANHGSAFSIKLNVN